MTVMTVMIVMIVMTEPTVMMTVLTRVAANVARTGVTAGVLVPSEAQARTRTSGGDETGKVAVAHKTSKLPKLRSGAAAGTGVEAAGVGTMVGKAKVAGI